MSYTFDPTSGDTRAMLVERVIGNSFSSTRFTEQTRLWLDEAVTDVCRKLRIQKTYAILDYDENGLVTQPASPFFQIEELWLANADASGDDERAFVTGARWQLAPLPSASPFLGISSGDPLFYAIRRQAFTGRLPQPRIAVVPARVAGKVAIVGLTRPAPMDSDDDVSGLGADLDRALVAFARSRAFEVEDDLDTADRWIQRYELALRDVIHLPDQTDEPEVVDGTWDC